MPAVLGLNPLEDRPDGGDLVVAARSRAAFGVVFELPANQDPLAAVRSFDVSWTYALGQQRHQQLSSFRAGRHAHTDDDSSGRSFRTGNWLSSRYHSRGVLRR